MYDDALSGGPPPDPAGAWTEPLALLLLGLALLLSILLLLLMINELSNGPTDRDRAVRTKGPPFATALHHPLWVGLLASIVGGLVANGVTNALG